ncbi:hypothetical protein FIV42_18315 [Persicimonas caeni]|uniref:Uncharacterized protein n=1 Tax=Persicimonas caeni TaxID=2292766 RepID=A0A4Y6PWL3_PERCE|nr:hypothetical protein [Persicimonas caeni]QDG52620.1 hypothetical protein FIV42_18315 [Persicimonas caeni]QED33842.1 hypothetical protein FRD00_18310 [Persicimonas caeni]
MTEVRIAYTTVLEEPRTGWLGEALRWMGKHPILAGLVGGLAAVLFAVARAFEGVRSAPFDALIISAIVVIVWMVLFYFLRGFFTRQALRTVEVRRDIEVTDEGFRWLQDDEELVKIEEPRFELFSTPVPDEKLDERKRDQPWPVWLVVSGRDGRFVLESKITAGEASEYPKVDDEVLEATDEALPTGLASSLLSCAGRVTD